MTKPASRRHAGAAFGGSCHGAGDSSGLGAMSHELLPDLSNGARGTQGALAPLLRRSALRRRLLPVLGQGWSSAHSRKAGMFILSRK